jgi:hypothetical protein
MHVSQAGEPFALFGQKPAHWLAHAFRFPPWHMHECISSKNAVAP